MPKRRKYNQILSCEQTPNGYWRVTVISPYEQIHRKLYVGYSKAAVLRKARTTDFDKEAGFVFNHPPER